MGSELGTLYIVGTPIGNLGDISPRAVGILRRVKLIATENPQRTQRLSARYEIRTPMMRFTDAYDRKKHRRIQAVLAALAEGDVALVSEAGMPGLADPGFELLQAVLERGIPVTPVPGPTALTAALAVAGISVDRFIFLGFLPRGRGARRDLLGSVAGKPFALVAYESPHRLLSTLEDLAQLPGQRFVAVAYELTKLYEEVQRGTARELLEYFRDHLPRGEFTLVIAPPSNASLLQEEGEEVK
ncbi:16S rRNA (cytidine(1402)-2'-O)-methyltransferase [Chloroflexota bacterium]